MWSSEICSCSSPVSVLCPGVLAVIGDRLDAACPTLAHLWTLFTTLLFIKSIYIYRKSITLKELSGHFAQIQIVSTHKRPQGDSQPARVEVWGEDQSEHHLMKPESGACSDYDGGAPRHAGVMHAAESQRELIHTGLSGAWNSGC